MNVKTSAEKEWLRKLTTGQPKAKEDAKTPQRVAEAQPPVKEPRKNGSHGFADVAGMDELKQMVKEGFINVLNNQECAKAFGITPPSLLFYGPAGCGKTYFAEKIAEEVGISFIKVCPMTWLQSLCMGHKKRLARCSVKQNEKLRRSYSLTSSTRWCPSGRMTTATIRTERPTSSCVC